MGRIQTIVCDACGAELAVEPLLLVAVKDPVGSCSFDSELCAPCFHAVWALLDPQGKRRPKPWILFPDRAFNEKKG